jgi:hypothetical protein
MKVSVKENEVVVDVNGASKSFKLGSNEIQEHGFQVVDHLVDEIIPSINKTEEVWIAPNTLESKMLARKIEDRIKRDVTVID